MEPLYFGEKENDLFGIFHEANPDKEKEHCILLCNPFGQEQVRCHRAYLRFAEKLADEGYHTLRFDYYGTGDSFGQDEDFLLKNAFGNIKVAIKELTEGCGLEKVILIGLRLGASLAFQEAINGSINGLVLWSPVYNGKAYLEEIQATHHQWLRGSFAKKGKVEGVFESHGFVISEHLKNELTSMEFTVGLKDQVSLSSVLIVDDVKNNNVEDLSKMLTNLSLKNEVLQIENPGFWLKQENEIDKSMVPVQEIDHIINWINKNF